jgi:hypothetical protein
MVYTTVIEVDKSMPLSAWETETGDTDPQETTS